MESKEAPSRYAYLAAAAEVLDDAVVGKDSEGIIRHVNRAAETLLGYTAAELIGRPAASLTPPGSAEAEAAILSRLGEDGPVRSVTTARLAKGGERLDVSLRVVPVRDESGRVVGSSEVMRLEDDASGSRARSYLAAIVESSDDAIIGKSLDGIIQSFNATAERMFGYKAAEVVGKPVTILIPPDRQNEEVDILGRLRKGERVDHFETVRVTKDGRYLDISLTVSPVRDSAGTIIGVSKIARDITERNDTARALAAQREWFRVTLGSIGDAVIASDISERVTFMNATAERLTGWKSEEAAGKPFAEIFQIVNERTRLRVENPARRVLATGRVVALANHTVLLGRDGRECPIDDSAAPILDDHGSILGVVLVFRDVTEGRRIEAERRAVEAERARLLENERLARAEAERANRVKDDFVAMVSHELRTPLNAILGWTDLLMTSRPDAATVQHGLEIVARNTRVQSQLISDLLDISRIVSGKLWLDIQTVDLAATIEGSLESVQHAAEAKGVLVQSSLDPDVGTVLGDPARLQQIVWNLLTNAIKFTPSGGRVFVGLRRDEDFAEITVSDSGAGIRADLLPDLFERFRHSGATTRSYGGLGLGLSIVKHLAELHGGHARAQSEGEGKGSKFTIEIPLAGKRSASGTPPRDSSGEGSHPQQEGISFRGVTVLVVEDEADTRDLLRRILEAHQAEVLTVASASEALACLATARPQILISDIGLPHVDGYELMRRIRRLGGALAALPAIALTAFARSEDRTRALRAGYQTHLAKPVEPSELLATVASLVDLTIPARKS